MAKDPAFLFYSSDFLTGCLDLTMEERGQYITILCLQHQKGRLKEKTIRLSVGNVSDDVLEKFKKDENNLLYNDRLEKEISKRLEFTESRRKNGAKGGRPRKPSVKPSVKPSEEPQENLTENENINENINIVYSLYEKFSGNSASVKTKTKKRSQSINARISEVGMDGIKEVLINLSNSDFLQGKTENSFKCDFDWVFNPNNFAKILEGKYNNKTKPKEDLRWQ